MISSWIAAVVLAGVAHGDGGDGDDEVRARMDPLSRGLLFPGRYEVVEPGFARLHPDVVHFENAQGAVLRGLWFENGDSDRTIVVCMGNTGNASWMVPHAAILFDAGFDVLLFDYQGFGPSEGVASLLSLPGDALAAWNWVTQEKGRKPEQIGVVGISLGSVLALQLAAEQHPRACAVEDVFFPDRQLEGFAGSESTPGMKALLAGLKTLVLPKIDPRLNAKKFRGPLFLMHGDLDWLLTPMATVELSELRPANRRTWILANTGHSPDSLQIDEWEYRDQLAGFFHDVFDGDGGADGSGTPAGALLAEPSATFSVESRDPPRVKVAVSAPHAGPVQVTLVAKGKEDKTLFHHERRLVAEGATSFECSPPFVPEHVLATAMIHAKENGDRTWSRELSPLSQSIVEFQEFVQELSKVEPDVAVRLESHSEKDAAGNASPGKDVREFRVRSAAQWPQLQKLIPDAESIHPRVRPRFAIYVARIAYDVEWMARTNYDAHDAMVAAAEAVLPFLPPDPKNFVTLGNAVIDVGFDNWMVEHALVMLWHDRLDRRDVAGAAAIWRELVKYLPAAEAGR